MCRRNHWIFVAFVAMLIFVSVSSAAPRRRRIIINQMNPPIKYPETRRVDQVDEYHGVKVPDPYRWLEGDVRESDEVATWVRHQNAIARKYLDAIPERPEIVKRLTALWNYERYSPPVKKGGKYFYSKN